MTTYSDITPRQTAYSMANFLKRALPLLTIERFGQQYPIPRNNTKVAKFRRYYLGVGTGANATPVPGGAYGPGTGNYAVPTATTALVEGTTPLGRKLASKDYTVTLDQYGDFVTFTDVMTDLHEDFPAVLREMSDILGEQAAITLETLRWNVLRAGTNVHWANGGVRTAVNTPVSLSLQRKITRALKVQNASKFTQVLSSSPAFNTQPIEASYIALIHPNVENDVRNMDGFISVKHYASTKAFEGEIGAVEDVRYISSTVFAGWSDAGGAKGAMMSTTGTDADVFPILYLARDAFGTVPLRGDRTGGTTSMNAAEIMVARPQVSPSDPLAQRGTAGWKAYSATVILQDAFMIRAEVAATD